MEAHMSIKLQAFHVKMLHLIIQGEKGCTNYFISPAPLYILMAQITQPFTPTITLTGTAVNAHPLFA